MSVIIFLLFIVSIIFIPQVLLIPVALPLVYKDKLVPLEAIVVTMRKGEVGNLISGANLLQRGYGQTLVFSGFLVYPENPKSNYFLEKIAIQLGAGRWLSIFAVSTLFIAMHIGSVDGSAMPSLFVISLGFGWVYEKTGRLWSSIVMHSLFNLTNILLATFAAAAS